MSTIKANTLLHSDGTTTTQPSIPALDKRMAHTWIKFNGTGSVAIGDSYNVSSLDDNGTGIYRVNFDTNPPNSEYSALISTNNNLNNTPWMESTASSTSSYQIRTYNGSAYVDTSRIMSVVFTS